VPFISRVRDRLRGVDPLPQGVDLTLVRGERVLTWGTSDGDRFVVATNLALYVTDATGVPVERHGWQDIDHAAWGPDGGLMVDTVDGERAVYRLHDPRGVPAAVRELVNASVVISERHPLFEGADRGVRVVARRDPASGRLIWSAVLDDGIDGEDPAVRDRAREITSGVRRRVGG
jgi:hypothetical protein